MILQILNQSKQRVPRQFLEQWLSACEKELVKKKVLQAKDLKKELVLVFLAKKPAQALNLEYRGKNYATDVLSFDSVDPDSLGELILCPEVLKKQALEHGLSYQLELGYMVLHGLLHLKGFDHERSEAEARQMFAIQDSIFDKLR